MKIVYKVIFALALAALLIAALWKMLCPPAPVGWREYAVKRGDTLWGIASAYGDDYDHRRIIYEIEQKNGCDANIACGDVLLVPVYE